MVRRLIGIKAARDVPYAFDACFNSWLAVRGGDQRGVMAPEGPNDAWETYAQRPAGSIATSTELPVARDEPVRSGAHAELSCGISDWDAVYPVHQVRLRVSSTARVYDVDSAADWHSLVRRYRDPATHPGPDDSLRNAAGIDNGPAPTWSTVARDYDGVHLTFAGLLTGPLRAPHHRGGQHHLVGLELGEHSLAAVSVHHRNTTG